MYGVQQVAAYSVPGGSPPGHVCVQCVECILGNVALPAQAGCTLCNKIEASVFDELHEARQACSAQSAAPLWLAQASDGVSSEQGRVMSITLLQLLR